MTQLIWDAVGDRRYETGVDQGVLYTDDRPGVPWNGLISVTDKSTGDGPTAQYSDGIKYLNMPSAEEFEATIEAFTYPEEFEVCDGSLAYVPGLLINQQIRQQFGLSYRTLVGNDVDGQDFGYKIHIIYNALASPSEKAYLTLTDDPEAINFNWDITTTPVVFPGFKPTAKMTLDSTEVLDFVLWMLEGILYGRDEEPRLPSPVEILALPWDGNARMIIVVENPDEELLPSDAEVGDTVFSISDTTAYSWGPKENNTKPVIVISNDDTNLLPESAVTGDIVYDESSGILYKLGA